MPYEMVLCVFLMLVFCVFMQLLTIKVMLMLFNAEKGEIKPIKVFEKPKRRKKMTAEQKKNARNDEILLHNYEVYDGTPYGQKDFE